MRKKALFFDVDGTLLSEITHKVPQSALCAIQKARACGHMTFVNSGRETCILNEIRSMIDMDGYLCGCGTQLIVHGETVYEHRLSPEICHFVAECAKKYDVCAVLEAQDCFFFPESPCRIEKVETVRASITRQNPNAVRNITDQSVFDKFCVWVDEKSDMDGFRKEIETLFTVIDRGNGMFECVPLGHSKATAIDRILEMYQIRREDAYVFGDSTNDLAMFEAVPNAILMGKHDKELEPYASFITKDVEDDGVAYAMEQLGII